MGNEKDSKDTETDSINGNGLEDEQVTLADADFSLLEDEAEEGLPGDPQSGSNQQGGNLAKLQAENEDLRNKYLRALADFENFKKRTLKERSELLKYQGERVFIDMLEIVDNLEYALQYAESTAGSEVDPVKLKEGLALIHKGFLETLGKWEVRAESAIGKVFDPSKNAAISKVPAPGVQPGTVLNELKKSYFYKDKLLRVGEVVVAGGEAEVSSPLSDGESSDENGAVGHVDETA